MPWEAQYVTFKTKDTLICRRLPKVQLSETWCDDGDDG